MAGGLPFDVFRGIFGGVVLAVFRWCARHRLSSRPVAMVAGFLRCFCSVYCLELGPNLPGMLFPRCFRPVIWLCMSPPHHSGSLLDSWCVETRYEKGPQAVKPAGQIALSFFLRF
jgi:hypothetical protein